MARPNPFLATEMRPGLRDVETVSQVARATNTKNTSIRSAFYFLRKECQTQQEHQNPVRSSTVSPHYSKFLSWERVQTIAIYFLFWGSRTKLSPCFLVREDECPAYACTDHISAYRTPLPPPVAPRATRNQRENTHRTSCASRSPRVVLLHRKRVRFIITIYFPASRLSRRIFTLCGPLEKTYVVTDRVCVFPSPARDNITLLLYRQYYCTG